jgi:hypothetical protein
VVLCKVAVLAERLRREVFSLARRQPGPAVRSVFMATAMLCGLGILLVGGQRLAASLLLAPGNQAAQLAIGGSALRPQSYERLVTSRDGALGLSLDRRSLIDLGFAHFNLASQAPADSPEQAALYEQSLEALHASLALSPAQPIAWLLAAGAYHELEAWPETARALQWAVRTGPHLATQHRTRTIVGLRVWQFLDAPTRRRLMDSVRATLHGDAGLVAAAAIAAGVESDLDVRLRLFRPEGFALAERLKTAVDEQRARLEGRSAGASGRPLAQQPALAVLRGASG